MDKLCVKCSFGAIFNINGLCAFVDPQCKAFDELLSICKSCYAGFELNSNNKCVKSEDNKISNLLCAEFNADNICIKCADRSYLGQNGNCLSIDPSCKTANLLNGECTSCYPGFSLLNEGRCLETKAK